MSRGKLIALATVLALAIGVLLTRPHRVSEIEKLLQISENEEVRLVFGGDVMLSRKIGKIRQAKKGEYPYELIGEFTRGADLVGVNLEGPIGTKGINQGSIYSFRADPETLNVLKGMGVDVVSLANNHIIDYGPEALLETFEVLTKGEISFAGAGRNFSEAHSPTVIKVKNTKFAFLSYTDLLPKYVGLPTATPAVALIDEKQIKSDIKNAKKVANVVVVFLHFGTEYQSEPGKKEIKLARGIIDSGATLVIGSHPHVPQKGEKYKDGFIAYSLGNLIFDQNFEGTKKGALLEVRMKNGNIKGTREIPIVFDSEYRPQIVEYK